MCPLIITYTQQNTAQINENVTFDTSYHYFTMLRRVTARRLCYATCILTFLYVWTDQRKRLLHSRHDGDKQKHVMEGIRSMREINPPISTWRPKFPNCAGLFSNDTEQFKQAYDYQNEHPKVPIKPSEYINMTRNCKDFRKNRMYLQEPLSEEETSFPIAFSILIYKDIEQFERLLRAIYRPTNYYCIHVDGKSDEDFRSAVHGITRCFHNVFISSRTVDVHWGGDSVLESELICIEDLWNKFADWKYFINLTGQEFPLQTMWDLVKILKTFNGTNDIEGTIEK